MTVFDELADAIRQHRGLLSAPERQRLICLIADGHLDTILGPRPNNDGRKPPSEEIIPGATIRDVLLWVEGYDQIKRAPTHIQVVSYVCYEEAGLEPHGSKKSWAAACTDLWEASGQSARIVQEAAKLGSHAREDGITISSPRSLQSYARNLRASGIETLAPIEI